MKNTSAACVTIAALSAVSAFATAPAPANEPAAKTAIAPAPAAATPAPAAKKAFVVPDNLETDGPFSPKKCLKRCMKELDDQQKCDRMCGSGTTN